MKRPLTTLAIAILTVVVLIACASTIRTGKTSIVTITIGGSSGTAVLKAEAATPWTRLKHNLADVKWISEAYAYIPSVVQVLTVTVTAPDITTPIVGVSSVSSTQTTATLTIEVPNGTDRHFLVEGLRALPSGATQVMFSGTNRTDLNGTDVNLQINMIFTGTGIYVNPGLLLTANTSTCGSSVASACATITHVLTTRPATTTNDVIVALAGNYNQGAGAPYESFPIRLLPGMTLRCLGPNFGSVIESLTPVGTTFIIGNDDAAVDNCKIRVAAEFSTGVSDDIGAQTAVPSKTKVNGALIELSGGGTSGGVTGVKFIGDSTLLATAITGSNITGISAIGAFLGSGKANIVDNVISNVAGFSVGVGINITAGAAPAIIGNIIENNSKGIEVPSGDGQITGNWIRYNTLYGVDISSGGTGTATGNPRINNNNIYCNGTDVNVVSPLVINLQSNAWDHDANTLPPGPVVSQGFISGGYDIIYSISSPEPTYAPFSTAVSGGCTTIIIAKPGM